MMLGNSCVICCKGVWLLAKDITTLKLNYLACIA